MRKIVLAAVLVLMASGAQAATLNVIGGQLMGASDVLVDGYLYDVQFLDGSCIDLYSGCDEVSDFTFQTVASARLASQALLDQVFLDGPLGDFDSDPLLTFGCDWGGYCLIHTPFLPRPQLQYPPGGDVVTSNAKNDRSSINQFGQELDYVNVDTLARPYDTAVLSGGIYHAYTGWVLVSIPEPNTALLLGIGLVGMAARRRV